MKPIRNSRIFASVAALFALALVAISTPTPAQAGFPLGAAQPTQRVYVFEYDFAVQGGAVSAITLTDDQGNAMTLPAGCIVRAYVNTITAMTSGGSATLKLGVTGDDDAFIAATAFDNGAFDADDFTELTAGIPLKITSGKSVLGTIATAALTAGKLHVHVYMSECDT